MATTTYQKKLNTTNERLRARREEARTLSDRIRDLEGKTAEEAKAGREPDKGLLADLAELRERHRAVSLAVESLEADVGRLKGLASEEADASEEEEIRAMAAELRDRVAALVSELQSAISEPLARYQAAIEEARELQERARSFHRQGGPAIRQADVDRLLYAASPRIESVISVLEDFVADGPARRERQHTRQAQRLEAHRQAVAEREAEAKANALRPDQYPEHNAREMGRQPPRPGVA